MESKGMRVLVINAGSSSIKYQLLEVEGQRLVFSGLLEKIGEGSTAHLAHRYFPEGGDEVKHEDKFKVANHKEGIHKLVQFLESKESGAIDIDIREVEAVGHRVVHGGSRFANSVVIDDEVLEHIRQESVLAPIHNPPSIACIEEAREQFAKAVHVAVFDTTFHHTLPERAYLYAVPYSWYSDLKIRRYGFHGTSHGYIAEQAAKLLQKPLEDLKLITLHLGNGASACAIKGGRSIDTSMGLTPLEGLVMGTRSGDLDPAMYAQSMMMALKKTPEEIEDILNHDGGLKGLSGANDMREIVKGMREGDPGKTRAYQSFCYRIKKYVGAYLAALEGADAIVFSAGIGENSSDVRATVCQGLEFMGIELDEEKNNASGSKSARAICKEESRVKVLVVPTNEELAIAMQTAQLAKAK